MDCNRDEAYRAKEFAISKFKQGDVNNAKRLALKAQQLYPQLGGISNLLTVLELHISAMPTRNGEKDWYKVLGVSALADKETITKQYKKMALIVHPDKNRDFCSAKAFTLLCDAFQVLKDDTSRSSYDRRVNIQELKMNVPAYSGVFPAVIPAQTGFSASSSWTMPSHSNFAHMNCPGSQSSQYFPPQATPIQPHNYCSWNLFQSLVPPASTPAAPPGYNQAYSFPNLGVFSAVQLPQGTHNKVRKQKSQNGSHSSSTTRNGVDGVGSFVAARPRKRTQNTSSQLHSSVAACSSQGRSSFWTRCNRCKMGFEFPLRALNQYLQCPNCQEAFHALETEVPQHFLNEPKEFSSSDNQSKNSCHQAGSSMANRDLASASCGPSVTLASVSMGFSPSAPQATNMVNPCTAKKGRKTKGDANLENKRQKSSDVPMMNHKHSDSLPDSTEIKNGGTGLTDAPGPENDQSARRMDAHAVPKTVRELSQSDVRKMLIEIAFLKLSKKVQCWQSASEAVATKEEAMFMTEKHDGISGSQCGGSSSASNQKGPEVNAMSVPDSDFHDFDKDRSLIHFKKNDMWAVYDDDDGMPRLYALIRKVISLRPFKLEMSWLNSKSSSEFGTIEWISQGFTKTCGQFRVGKCILNHSSNIFSHKVECKTGHRGAVQVYPAKGDVWVLYKNWSPDWSFETPENLRRVYEVVEVLGKYTDEQGVSVIPLVKVAGFHTVFSRTDLKEVRRIRKEEMFRFSHQIPSYLLSGKEAPNAPGGCLELDPASLSEELLQVIPAADNNGLVRLS